MHNITLVKERSRLDVRKYSFFQRTIDVWNKLYCKNCDRVTAMERHARKTV